MAVTYPFRMIMGSDMKKAIYLAAAAILATATPARAGGTGVDDPVHIGVIGSKLKVTEVRGPTRCAVS